MSFNMLPNDIMEYIWNMKEKAEALDKLDKVEKSAKRNYNLVMRELKKRIRKDTLVSDTLEDYDEYGMGDGSNIYSYCADQLQLPDSEYTIEEEDEMIEQFINYNNIIPVRNRDNVEYFKVLRDREILRKIYYAKRRKMKEINNRKIWDFRRELHIFRILNEIRYNGLLDAPLKEKFPFLRATA